MSPTVTHPRRLLALLFAFTLLPLPFTNISFRLPLSQLLFGGDLLPCFPFCTVSLCMALRVAITRPALSSTPASPSAPCIYVVFAAVAEACTPWLLPGEAARSHVTSFLGVHVQHTCAQRDILEQSRIIGQLCLFLLVWSFGPHWVHCCYFQELKGIVSTNIWPQRGGYFNKHNGITARHLPHLCFVSKRTCCMSSEWDCVQSEGICYFLSPIPSPLPAAWTRSADGLLCGPGAGGLAVWVQGFLRSLLQDLAKTGSCN